jgi:hypothetical protein
MAFQRLFTSRQIYLKSDGTVYYCDRDRRLDLEPEVRRYRDYKCPQIVSRSWLPACVNSWRHFRSHKMERPLLVRMRYDLAYGVPVLKSLLASILREIETARQSYHLQTRPVPCTTTSCYMSSREKVFRHNMGVDLVPSGCLSERTV